MATSFNVPKTKEKEKESFLDSAKSARLERQKEKEWGVSATVIQVIVLIHYYL